MGIYETIWNQVFLCPVITWIVFIILKHFQVHWNGTHTSIASGGPKEENCVCESVCVNLRNVSVDFWWAEARLTRTKILDYVCRNTRNRTSTNVSKFKLKYALKLFGTSEAICFRIKRQTILTWHKWLSRKLNWKHCRDDSLLLAFPLVLSLLLLLLVLLLLLLPLVVLIFSVCFCLFVSNEM